jgi:hypothetical protein
MIEYIYLKKISYEILHYFYLIVKIKYHSHTATDI